jgi:hypothetical protein
VGTRARHREVVLSGLKEWRLACDGRYKYVTGFGRDGDLLFDLAEDPHEDRNLAASPPEEALRLRDVLRERAAQRTTGAAAGAG